MERLGLRQMLLEPELLATVEADVHLCATIVSLASIIPQRTRETARSVVRKVVEEVERRLSNALQQAVRGALARATRSRRPRLPEIDWDRTVRANLSRYDRDRRTVIAEKLIGHGRRRSSLRDVILCVDQSGSMATSVVYSSIFAAVMASIRALSTRLVVFDTSIVDLTAELADPVEVLFGTQLGGGTDINRAVAYCQQMITRPTQTVFLLITDLYEGGNAEEMIARVRTMKESGVTVICLLALNDQGAPMFDARNAAAFAALGVPTFACTPDAFPEMIAAALAKRDVGQWASERGIVGARQSWIRAIANPSKRQGELYEFPDGAGAVRNASTSRANRSGAVSIATCVWPGSIARRACGSAVRIWSSAAWKNGGLAPPSRSSTGTRTSRKAAVSRWYASCARSSRTIEAAPATRPAHAGSERILSTCAGGTRGISSMYVETTPSLSPLRKRASNRSISPAG
jgi:Mg-chelatase subunit ChlD